MLLLDSCSTVDLFCNKNLVTKIWKSKNSMIVKVNGGNLKTHKKEYVKNYGKVWFDERATTNIMSLKNAKEKFRVTYESDRDGTFTIHKPNGVNINFGIHRDRLHYHDTVNRQVTMVQTVTENERATASANSPTQRRRDTCTKKLDILQSRISQIWPGKNDNELSRHN